MCDFSPLSAKDKSTSQTPAECVKVFHNLANAEKKQKKLTDLSIPLSCLYISVSCFHERVYANVSSPLQPNMLFRCLHHIDLRR